jgi:hypothetical protein
VAAAATAAASVAAAAADVAACFVARASCMTFGVSICIARTERRSVSV